MNPDVVLVPTLNRPELLALCLERLTACPEIQDKWIRVCCDSRGLLGKYWEETAAIVRDVQAAGFHIVLETCPQHSYHGNSYNVLTGYWRAWADDARRVYLVEDDVMVSPDFFRWHDAMLERHPELFCSVGWHCLRRSDVPRNATDPHGYFRSKEDYASIGVCWSHDMLGRVVAHAIPAYFDNPVGYLRQQFPFDPLSLDFSEQDGLIMRVLRATGAPVSWPLLRRCSHTGWYGYHRPDGPKLTGDISVRIQDARRIISDPELMRKCGVRFGGDTEPIIPPTEWDKRLLLERKL